MAGRRVTGAFDAPDAPGADATTACHGHFVHATAPFTYDQFGDLAGVFLMSHRVTTTPAPCVALASAPDSRHRAANDRRPATAATCADTVSCESVAAWRAVPCDATWGRTLGSQNGSTHEGGATPLFSPGLDPARGGAGPAPVGSLPLRV